MNLLLRKLKVSQKKAPILLLATLMIAAGLYLSSWGSSSPEKENSLSEQSQSAQRSQELAAFKARRDSIKPSNSNENAEERNEIETSESSLTLQFDSPPNLDLFKVQTPEMLAVKRLDGGIRVLISGTETAISRICNDKQVYVEPTPKRFKSTLAKHNGRHVCVVDFVLPQSDTSPRSGFILKCGPMHITQSGLTRISDNEFHFALHDMAKVKLLPICRMCGSTLSDELCNDFLVDWQLDPNNEIPTKSARGRVLGHRLKKRIFDIPEGMILLAARDFEGKEFWREITFVTGRMTMKIPIKACCK